MIFEFDSNRGLFVTRSTGPKKRSGGCLQSPEIGIRVSPKYLSNETKIYIFIARIPRVVYMIFWGFSPNFIFPTTGQYLQTSALNICLPLAWFKSSYISLTICPIYRFDRLRRREMKNFDKCTGQIFAGLMLICWCFWTRVDL